MSRLGLLLGRELRGFLMSPVFWLLVTLAWLITGLQLRFQILPTTPGGDLSVLLSRLATLVVQLQIFFVPLLTMRAIAEEKRSGTFEMLVTAPVRDHEVVLAKYLAALLVNALTWLVLPLSFYVFSSLKVQPDFAVVWMAYTGVVAVGGVFVAAGILASATSQHQILAGFLAVVLISLLFFLPWITLKLDGLLGSTINRVVTGGNLQGFMTETALGILDLVNLTYALGLICVLLLFATRILEIRKWR